MKLSTKKEKTALKGKSDKRYAHQFIQKLMLSLAVAFAFTTNLYAAGGSGSGEGANGGGGGGMYLGKKPSTSQVESYLKEMSAIRVRGYIHSLLAGDNFKASKSLLFMSKKIASGLKIEIKNSGPCKDENDDLKIASIHSKMADICFSPSTFVEQKELPVNLSNFEKFVDAIVLHEVLHLAQLQSHAHITVADEVEARKFQGRYLEDAERGLRPTDAEISQIAMAAYQAPKTSLGFQVTGDSNALCNTALNYMFFVEPLLLFSTGVIVNQVHLVSMDSEYWARDSHAWRAAFTTEEELDLVTRVPRGKKYQLTPSFIQIAQMMKRYHCSGSNDFSNYREQTYGSKKEMYEAYRDLMIEEVDLIAQKTIEVIKSKFQLVREN